MKRFFLAIPLLFVVTSAGAEPILEQTCTQDESQTFSHLHLNFSPDFQYEQLKIQRGEEVFHENFAGFPGGDYDAAFASSITAIELSYIENGQNVTVQETVTCLTEVKSPELAVDKTPTLDKTELPSAEPSPIVLEPLPEAYDSQPEEEATQIAILPDSTPSQTLIIEHTRSSPRSKSARATRSGFKSDTAYDFSENIID